MSLNGIGRFKYTRSTQAPTPQMDWDNPTTVAARRLYERISTDVCCGGRIRAWESLTPDHRAAWERHTSDLIQWCTGGTTSEKQDPSINHASFKAGADAMRNELMIRKYDALKEGRLDLERFDIRTVEVDPK